MTADADSPWVQGLSRMVGLVVATASLALPAAAFAAVPSDPLYGQQTALAQGASIGAPQAWDRSTGRGTVVAILDTGADLTHPDLAGALWTNPGEIPGNGIDDDGDGYVDDVHGVNIVGHNGDPTDDEGHGTHVAGIVGARANNGEGGLGLAPDTSLMIVKVLDSHRTGTAADLATGIEYALAHGARIINTSVNGDAVSSELRAAIADATSKGALVVASAGNDGRNIDTAPSYPASYPDASIITVGAEDESGSLSSFSNSGTVAVDLLAPGQDILSTANGGGYELRAGTSMAAPFVSATLALMTSLRPDLGGPDLKAALLGAAHAGGPLTGVVGAGSLDAAGAVQAVGGQADPMVVPAAPAEAAVTASAASMVGLRVLKAGRRKTGAVLRWVVSGDRSRIVRVRVTVDGRVVGVQKPGARSRLVVRGRAGKHRYRVLLLGAGNATLAKADGRFTVARPRARQRG